MKRTTSLLVGIVPSLWIGCTVEEGRSLDDGPDDRAVATPSSLSQIEPSTIWPVTLEDGHLHISINAEEDGRKIFYNFDYTDGEWWSESAFDFDTDLSVTHPWKELTLIDGMHPWGSDWWGNRLDGPMTAGYTYTAEDGTDMFTFMNRDKFWVMCTANCEQHDVPMLGELFSGKLDELADGQPSHPWARLRRGDGSRAWTGSGITGAFQHPSGDFYLFNEGEYWVLRTGTPGSYGACFPEGETRFGCLYAEQTAARSVSDLTGGVLGRVSAAISLAPEGSQAETLVLLEGSRWVEFDAGFSPLGHEGQDVSNLMSCLRFRTGCGGSEPEPEPEPGGTLDLVDYVLTDCSGPSEPTQLGSEVMFTIPMGESGGRAKFVWMKGGEDGNGFEEWYVDDQWFYLRLDTTWAYERNGEFCDTQCGNSNEYPCRRRWAGEEGDFAYTVYHDPASGSEPARWLPRRLDLAMDGGWVPYASEMGIKAERFSDCSECTNDFTSPHVGRSGEARRHSSWGGFSDVVELHITAGPGAGEHYYYARGRGWVGFGVDGGETTGADATAPQSSKFPNMACGNGYATASVCGVAG